LTHIEDVGIIIVTHNSAAEIGNCLDAAVTTGAKVIVIDNNSHDDTCREVQRRAVPLIANSTNAGFAAAVNQGMRALATPLALLLNPDAIIQNSLEPLRNACRDPNVAAAGGALVDNWGHPQVGFMVRRFPTPAALCLEALLVNRIWPHNPVNWHYRCLDLGYASPVDVDQPAGAFLMIRRDAWEKLGGFDENFHPLWFEDVDFLKRAKDLGYRVCFVPGAVAKHTGAHSIRKISLEFRQFYWYRSLLKYAAKHFPPGAEKAVCLAVIIGSVLRTVLGIPRQRSLKPIAVYGKVVKLAGRQLFFGTAG
jgi:N-acetylglucosaminyl-diphospho-decaprenol L-rhamnosyltransferase